MFQFLLLNSRSPDFLCLCETRQCLPARSLSFLSINFIFICYLQALQNRPFPKCVHYPTQMPCSTNAESLTSLPYLVASSPCFLRRVLVAQVFTCIFTVHQSSLTCARRHLALSALQVLFPEVSPLLFWLQLLMGHSVCCDIWYMH